MDRPNQRDPVAPESAPRTKHRPLVDSPEGQPASAEEPAPRQAGNRDRDGIAADATRQRDVEAGWEYDDPPAVQTGDETPPTA